MSPEETFVATALHAWNQNIDRANKVFSDLSDDDLQKAIAPGRNRLAYLMGHLVVVHDAMLPLLDLGPRLHPELDGAFLTNADDPAVAMPGADELRRLWNEVHERLRVGFAGFSAADWLSRHTAVSVDDFAKNPLRNRLAVLLSRTSHIGYHVGQAALVAK